MKKIIELFNKHLIGLTITSLSILFVLLLHRSGVFEYFELKVIDIGFKTRGPISGWAARNEIPKDSLEVVIVDVDDESYRLVPYTWPYPREVWGSVVDNLSNAGAKVIVFDIQFDSPDRQSEYLKEIRKNLNERGFSDLVPDHGDSIFANSIINAKNNGTSVILASKLVQEATRQPPQYIQLPNKILQNSEPDYGLVNEQADRDGFSRQYYTFFTLDQNPGVWYPSLGIKAIQRYLDFPDSTLPRFNDNYTNLKYGPLQIPFFSSDARFLVNIYGPPSGYNIIDNEAWKTFNRYPLSNVIDVFDVDLNDLDEDTDWMENFLPGEIPQWINDIDDPSIDKNQLMSELGIGLDFDITQSPFYNKIVLIGVSVEVLHDFKRTSFFSFARHQWQMPGVEYHANAIQTMLDGNYIKIFGGDINWSSVSWFKHFLLISFLSLVAYIFISSLSPLLAGIFILMEILIFYSIAVGAFTNDYFWILKILTNSWSKINTPGINDSYVIPVIPSIIGVFITYTSNVLYRIAIEQKDKRFLKNTFGTYVSPQLIDRMYDSKQEPKLGGEAGYHTAFFSDIQSFSSFSEVLEPEKMVSLMNEYLTEMTDILLENRGTLDKYIGDAIVAFYGAPVKVRNHEYLACKTALDMESHLNDLRKKWSKDNTWPDIVKNIRHRVGLNSGDMVTGNMGSNMRMNYTMMGDTVNIAARLEASAKQYGVYIQVAENTYNAVSNDFEWRFLDNVKVKGKSKPVRVFELLSHKGKLGSRNKSLLSSFSFGIENYKKQKWKLALKDFEDSQKFEDMFISRSTNPSLIYIERCKYFIENPPNKDWDGIWTLNKK
tara:strand:+ start:5293 stop:7776 length:2484 start_codon:yes stop_codon:yes gene_type:complete